MTAGRSVLQNAIGDFRHRWKQLAVTDVIYKIIAYVILTPLVSIILHILLSVSGNTVLADQDILFFFVGPVGWLCCIAVGGATLAIVAIEHAALMAVLCAEHEHQRISLVHALRFALANAWPVLQVTARMVGITLLAVAPFLAVAGIAYSTLLSDFDINYYLQEKPPAFLIALGIGGVLAIAIGAVLLRLFTGWFFALPIVLFEDVKPSDALRESKARARGHRVTLLLWIVGWTLASTILSAVATSIVIGLGRSIVPHATESLVLLSISIGIALVVWAVVNLALNLLSTIGFAILLYNLYGHLASPGDVNAFRLNVRTDASKSFAFRLTLTRLFLVCVIGVVAATTVGAVALQTVRLDDDVAIIAHRGSSMSAPENTMAAVKQAIVDGADWIEIDVQETADGEVVVFHDSDFMKLAGVNLKIWNANMAELKDIDVGSWFAAEFKDERVPTLADVLDECKGKAGVNIELKYYGHDKRLEQRVAEIVEAHEMASNVVIMSLKLAAVRKMKALRPDWKVGLLMSMSAGDLRNSGADFLAVNASFASRNFVGSAHKRGQDVYVWTVNDAPTMSNMIGCGVNGLITDKPALGRAVLAQRADMSPLQRLLLELAETFGVAPEMGEM